MCQTRKKGYFVHEQVNDESGVSKKIRDQMTVFSHYFDIEEICLSKNKENWLIRKIRMKILRIKRPVRYRMALRKINSSDFLYIRKPLLEPRFYKFLDGVKRKRRDCYIIVEIPTYPYLKEIITHNRTSLKNLEIEKAGIPRLHKYADKVVAVCNNKEIFGIETICVTNGINVSRVPVSNKERETTLNLIAVAQFQESHGYERIIESLIKYYESGGDRDVAIHFVGNGTEEPYYRGLAENPLIREKVFFYGFKTGDELEGICRKADMGLGCFGFYKRGIDVSSALKIREYLSRGLPVVYAAKEPCFEEEPTDFALELSNDASPIDMNEIIDFYDGLFANGESAEELHTRIRDYALRHFDMEVTMKPIIDEIQRMCSA